MATSPYVRGLRLANELRKIRTDAGLTAEGVAKQLRVSRVKITHLETAARRPDIGDVMNLLDTLGVTGAKFDEVVRVARDAAERGWWEERRFKLMGDRQAQYANLEYGAERIREYALAFMPGLLQTEEYIRARNAGVPAREQTTWNVEGATLGRLERQRVFSHDNGPALDVIAEEIAVIRPTAPPQVMARQLRHLAEMADSHPRVNVRVLPVNVDMMQPLLPSTTFYLYTYPDRQDPTVVSVEAPHKDLTWIDDVAVGRYERLWERLDEVALPQKKSIDLLTKTIKQITQ